MNKLSPHKFLILCLVIGAITTLLGFIGQYYWLFDMLSHFREYFVYLFAALVLCAAYLRSRLLLGSAAIFLVINLMTFAPLYGPVPQLKATTSDDLLIFFANVEAKNTAYDTVVQYVKKVDPDVVILAETHPVLERGIAELKDIYPYTVGGIDDSVQGILLLSKTPIEQEEIIRIHANRPNIRATVTKGKNTITLVATHALPPFNKRLARLRDEQLTYLSEIIGQQELPTILIGDINTTPFSYMYRYLLRENDLMDCARSFGYQRTWQLNALLPPLGLSIDHCLRTQDIVVIESYVGEDIGSDHRPIINRVTVNN